jgi:hypothetical protein
MKRHPIITFFVFGILSYINCAIADTISFDTTTTAGWTATAAGAINANPFVVTAQETIGAGGNQYHDFLSVTSTGNNSGTFLQGGSIANFTGFWIADYTFVLPQNATGVSFSYDSFFADDRAVLYLNGQSIAATGIYADQGGGEMVFADGSNSQSYSFSSAISGTTSSGFNIGGENIIEVIVNNTGQGIYGSDKNISQGDNTLLSLSGMISFSSVPEPSSLAVIGVGILSLFGLRTRKQ